MSTFTVINIGGVFFLWTIIPPSGVSTFIIFLCTTIFTVVCGIRSLFPRVDLQRYVLFDHWASSIAIGRTLATIGELCFALLVVIFLKLSATVYGVLFSSIVFTLLILSIISAQCFCWYGIIRKNHLTHAFEESCWLFFALGICVVSILIAFQSYGVHAVAYVCYSIIFLTYAGYLLFIDIPMYYNRWKNETLTQTSHGAHILKDVFTNRVVISKWQIWRPEVMWMTPYFIGGPFLCFGTYLFAEIVLLQQSLPFSILM